MLRFVVCASSRGAGLSLMISFVSAHAGGIGCNDGTPKNSSGGFASVGSVAVSPVVCFSIRGGDSIVGVVSMLSFGGGSSAETSMVVEFAVDSVSDLVFDRLGVAVTEGTGSSCVWYESLAWLLDVDLSSSVRLAAATANDDAVDGFFELSIWVGAGVVVASFGVSVGLEFCISVSTSGRDAVYLSMSLVDMSKNPGWDVARAVSTAPTVRRI